MTIFDALSTLFSLFAFIIAVFSLIEIKAMQRSTHSVQFFNPVTKEFEIPKKPEGEALTPKTFDEEFDNI